MVRASAWVGQDSQDRARPLWGRKFPGRSGSGHYAQSSWPWGSGDPHGRLHLALRQGPDRGWTTRRYGNHTWMTTPVSEARAEEGQVPKEKR